MKHAIKGTADECLKFMTGTAPDTEGWWYHGATHSECQTILQSVHPFRDATTVHFSNLEGGCRHKAEHTHAIRATVHVSADFHQEYGIEDATASELIMENEFWLKVHDPRRIMIDAEFLKENPVAP